MFTNNIKFQLSIVSAAHFRLGIISHPHHSIWEITWTAKVGRYGVGTYIKSSVRLSQHSYSFVQSSIAKWHKDLGPLFFYLELETTYLTQDFYYLDISSYKCWLGTYRDRTKRRMATSRRLSNYNQYEAPIYTISKYIYNRCSRDQI